MNVKPRQYTISQLSARLDISSPTLRFWEREFAGIFKPLRTDGGQRRYTDEHLAVLEKIIGFKQKGMTLAEIRSELLQAPTDHPVEDGQDPIDTLTERISRAVRKEIHQFFRENGKVEPSGTASRRGNRK